MLLSDYKTFVRLPVHFQIPESASTEKCIEQLNRITENLLTPFFLKFPVWPTTEQVERHLHVNLVRCQNELGLSVLRVSVPFVLPVVPDPPKGVDV